MADCDIGDLIRVDAEFRDDTDTLVDPTALTLKVKPPDGDAVTYTHPEAPIVRDAAGLYHADLSPDAAGSWGYRWVSTGVAQGAEPGQFFVRPEFHELWRPNVADVGALLRARTRTAGGLRPGTFTDDTEPTGSEVEALISRAAADVFADLEADPVPVGRQQKARYLTALRAAMYVELSYYPEQVNSDASIYEELKALYDQDLAKLKDAIVDAADETGPSPDAPLPLGTFPGSDVQVDRVGWGTWW
jgi:hypothetical protein